MATADDDDFADDDDDDDFDGENEDGFVDYGPANDGAEAATLPAATASMTGLATTTATTLTTRTSLLSCQG